MWVYALLIAVVLLFARAVYSAHSSTLQGIKEASIGAGLVGLIYLGIGCTVSESNKHYWFIVGGIAVACSVIVHYANSWRYTPRRR